MRPTLIKEIERITGDRLTPVMREEIADAAIKIIDDFNKSIAHKAIQVAQKAVEAQKDNSG